MTELESLLQQKYEWLKKFVQLTQGYYAQLLANEGAALEDIDYFLNNRQSLLNIVESSEKKITNLIKLNRIDSDTLAQVRVKVGADAKEQANMAELIRDLDEKILRILARAKDESAEQLKQITRGKRAISGYRVDNNGANRLDVQR